MRQNLTAPLIEFPKDYTADLMVGQANQAEKYPISFFTPFDLSFGFLHGGLNTLPKEGRLSLCGTNSQDMRTYANDMFDYWERRNFEQFVDGLANALGLVNNTAQFCYYGTLDWIEDRAVGYEDDGQTAQVSLLDPQLIARNVGFNIGFIWTDIVMLLLANPSNTEGDYFYFVAFYAGDLLFRFFVASNSEENCWYPWACNNLGREYRRIITLDDKT